MGNFLEAKDISKSFRHKKVLESISFNLPEGETLCILGKSGSGKTVLLKILVGLIKPDRGGVKLFGEEILNLKRGELFDLRKRVGFVFQNSALFDSFSVFENIAYPLKIDGAEEQYIREKVIGILKFLHLEGTEDLMVSELSGGMKKRVAIARALIRDPKLVFFDEPTAGIDIGTTHSILEIIKDLKRNGGSSAVVVTHDIDVAYEVASRILILKNGKFVKELLPQEIKKEELEKFFE